MNELKVIAITKPRDFYRIGKDFNNSVWYNTKNVTDVKVSQRDVVEIESEKVGTENVLKSIKIVGKAPQSTTPSTSNGWRSKSPEESNSIRKQAVGKMVAESLKSMDLKDQGIVEIEEIIVSLFKKYDELTK